MTIQYNDPRAVLLRAWLNANYRAYVESPVTDAQLSVWLDEAETSEGIVEIPAHESITGTTLTYRVELD